MCIVSKSSIYYVFVFRYHLRRVEKSRILDFHDLLKDGIKILEFGC